MAKFLILEDSMQRIETFGEKICLSQHDVIFVTTAQEAVERLSSEQFDVIFLDHDLGGEVYVDPSNENTGSGVVRWMLKNVQLVGSPDIVVHSMNTPTAQAMVADLKTKYRSTFYIPFPILISNHLNEVSDFG
jgi:CheY-like chemotaxis protein